MLVTDLPAARPRAESAGFAFAAADVRDPDAVAAAVAEAATLGPLRIVVNCAGVAPPSQVLRKGEPMTLEAFTTTIEVNLIGSFNVIRLAAAQIARGAPVDGGRGVIVSMTLPIARDLAQSLIRAA